MNGNDRGISSDDDPAIADETHWQQAAQRHYDPDRGEGLTAGIVFAIAAAEDVSPSELTSLPLYEVVDVAGIEQSFFGADQSETA